MSAGTQGRKSQVKSVLTTSFVILHHYLLYLDSSFCKVVVVGGFRWF